MARCSNILGSSLGGRANNSACSLACTRTSRELNPQFKGLKTGISLPKAHNY